MSDMRVSDYGYKIKITLKDSQGIVVNLSSATGLDLILRRPDNTVLEVTPSLFTDGTDGVVQYVTAPGDLSKLGTWKCQVKVTYSGALYHSTIGSFKVSLILA